MSTSAERGLAVVTGARGAIGGAIAAACADAGFRLVVVARSARSAPGEVVEADLGTDVGIAAACERLSSLTRLSLLVHGAGAYERGGVADVDEARLRELLMVNVQAPYALTRAALPALRAARGTVAFVNSSAAARDAVAGVTAYAITKHALRGLADGLRADENRNGVSVVSLYPGRTAGPVQRRLHADEGTAYESARLLQPADIARALIDAVSVPDSAEVTDLHIRPRQRPAL